MKAPLSWRMYANSHLFDDFVHLTSRRSVSLILGFHVCKTSTRKNVFYKANHQLSLLNIRLPLDPKMNIGCLFTMKIPDILGFPPGWLEIFRVRGPSGRAEDRCDEAAESTSTKLCQEVEARARCIGGKT